MSEGRPLLAQAFPGTSTTAQAKVTKRCPDSTPELFFTPAATSFKPRPYAPNATSISDSLRKPPHISRNHSRTLETLAIPPAGMDPQPSDPNVLFIHPPFVNFPDSHDHPEGLSYALLAENSEWFLDADDFTSQNNTNPRAIAYPPHLEPPRGWCPAKKKDLRDRGSEGWPEGEEPRLRCTFCRRTYAGVNAKSMWRRHVFEKHKIAMSNRREGNDRPRGRGSNKENRQPAFGKNRDEGHDQLLNMAVAPYTETRNMSHKSRFRSVAPVDVPDRVGERSSSQDTDCGSRLSQQTPPNAVDEQQPKLSAPISPPLTPQTSSDPVGSSFRSDSLIGTSPASMPPPIPPSPYDPLLTPSFRHAPPRLPSDQPWRFPSPSHPLHSRSREISLSMLIRDLNSPLVKGSLHIDSSPSQMIRASPRTAFSFGKPNIIDPDMSDAIAHLHKGSPRTLFSRGHLQSPLSVEKRRRRVEESPLSRFSTTRTHKRTVSELTDDWLSSGPLEPSASPLNSGELLANQDPFVTIYSSWVPISNTASPSQPRVSPLSIPDADSPVLRSGELPTGVGLGIGLLEPFRLPRDGATYAGIENSSLTDDDHGATEIDRPLTYVQNGSTKNCESTPPFKRRKTTEDDD
ncbi:hypothetical protein BD779DRAFT_1431694 [Infundibulicybe gibba]|nr:hypothetical protein BD779DRAFT_1431694 [Infundibulicybe gibba]